MCLIKPQAYGIAAEEWHTHNEANGGIPHDASGDHMQVKAGRFKLGV